MNMVWLTGECGLLTILSLCVFLSVRMNTGSCLCSVRILWWVFWTSVVTQRKWKPFWTVMWTRTRPQNTRDPVWAASNSPSNMKLKRWEHSYPCKAYSIIFNTQIRPLNNQHDQNFADKPVTHILSSKSAVFNSSPRAPPLCTFCMFLSSLQTFVLFDRKCPAKWTSQDIPPSFQFEASVYVPFKGHWSVRDVNLNWIYLQRYILSHFTSKFRLCVMTLA